MKARPDSAAGDALPRATPMMAQYFEIKAANPDSLLFYRMGDFYELFFDDAEIAARALGIVLTKRGKHMGEDIRMCGVPIERADDYLQKLISLGHRVAVCEQREIVAPQSLFDDPAFTRLVAETKIPATPFARETDDAGAQERRVREFYGVETLEGFGAFARAEIAACALALAYVERTQLEQRP